VSYKRSAEAQDLHDAVQAMARRTRLEQYTRRIQTLKAFLATTEPDYHGRGVWENEIKICERAIEQLGPDT
jgi:hypothetical protein